MLLAKLILFSGSENSKYEKLKTKSVFIGNAIINPASSGRLPDSQEQNDIVNDATIVLAIISTIYNPLNLPVKLALKYLPESSNRTNSDLFLALFSKDTITAPFFFKDI